jgi:NADH-quinone oxidoreductase subunit L
MTEPITLALILLFLPLLGFTIQILFGRFLPRQGDFIATACIGGSAAIALYLFFTLLLGDSRGMEPIERQWEWLRVGVGGADLTIHFGILLDNVTLVMLVVVAFISFLIHVYSIGYMHGEDRYSRFFAYMELFSFSMLGLVLTNNLFFMFVFWELVGVCSYFLIGFYFYKQSAANACMKAFIVNRIGDAGFLLGIMTVLFTVGSFAFRDVFASLEAGVWTPGLLTLAALLLFCGPIGKSAQFPLHVWLPDAMEGPTPVSALIHAATMVAAGVYFIVRMFPFFAGLGYLSGDYYSSVPLLVVAFVGAFTALFAATIALAQSDIKKVLAYSTVSQLGYMVLAVGVGSFTAGLFHLFTHAFFKACLFLGAGSVIHAVHSNELPVMGGLRRKMPLTFWTFLISTMAIAGVPFLFSGFYSKEAVLTQALAWGIHHGSPLYYVPFLMAITAALLTAFYMFRIIFLAFTGEPRDRERYEHAHESPRVMTIPLVALSAVAIFGAGFNFFGLSLGGDWFENRVNEKAVFEPYVASAPAGAEREDLLASLGPVQEHGGAEEATGAHGHGGAAAAFHEAHEKAHYPTLLLSLAAAGLGILLSWRLFSGSFKARDIAGDWGFLTGFRKLLWNLYFVDWFYNNVIVKGVLGIRLVLYFFDKYFIDGLVNLCGFLTRMVAKLVGIVDYRGVDGAVRGTGEGILDAGDSIRRIQTGRLQDYVLLTVFSIAAVFVVVVVIGNVFFG